MLCSVACGALVYHFDPVPVFTCREAITGAQMAVFLPRGIRSLLSCSEDTRLSQKKVAVSASYWTQTEQYCDRPGSRGVGTQDVQKERSRSVSIGVPCSLSASAQTNPLEVLGVW
jgi:hypothetical protein